MSAEAEVAGSIACKCKRLNDDAHRLFWRVTLRKGRVDAKGRFHDATLSTVRCFKCKTAWRTGAAWADDLEDAMGSEIEADALGLNSYDVKHWGGTAQTVRATFFEDDEPCFQLIGRTGHYYAELDKHWSQVPDDGQEPDNYCSWRWWVFHHYGDGARKIARIEYDGAQLREGKLRGFGVGWSLGDTYYERDTLRGLLVQIAYSEG